MFEEHFVIIAGDSFIMLAFCIEGINILRTKSLSRIEILAYVFFTLGSIMWLTYGIVSGSKWIRFANAVSVLVQMSVLSTVFYRTVFTNAVKFKKLKGVFPFFYSSKQSEGDNCEKDEKSHKKQIRPKNDRFNKNERNPNFEKKRNFKPSIKIAVKNK